MNAVERATVFARLGLAEVPKLLTLLDRNPHSPTFGCFDRNHWHYKIIDFPAGMAGEFVYPLALAWSLDATALGLDNPWRGQSAVRGWVVAGLRYAAASAHRDGSCDDYFPHERAAGATAFSLLAAVESCRLLGLDDDGLFRFLERRARWLGDHDESGRLSNHQALIALSLLQAGSLLGTDAFDAAARRRVDRLLAWQDPEEGWFPEYEGADAGYQTLTLGCLVEVLARQPDDEALRAAISRGVGFVAQMVHPDGSFGGEYTSRNTYNFFPHGFEHLASRDGRAGWINSEVARGLAGGRGACYSDDHIIGHHAWSYLLAAARVVEAGIEPAEPVAPDRPPRLHWPRAGLLIDRSGDRELRVALRKGGVYKAFVGGRLARSDTQISLRVGDGVGARTAVAHLVADDPVTVEADRFVVEGAMGWAKQPRMTTFKLLVLRGLSMTIGRVSPNVLRRLLQRLLIVGRKPAPFRYRREFTRGRAGRWRVRDEIHAEHGWDAVTSAIIAPDQTSIYVVMSRTFQLGQLQPVEDLTEAVRRLGPGDPLVVEREL